MKITVPVVFTDAIVTDSNLSEDPTYSVWSSGTTYAVGEYAYVLSTHTVYISTANSNLNNDPTLGDAAWWTVVSPTNKWKCLYTTGASPTVAEDDSGITYEFTAAIPSTEVGFLGLKAASVTVAVKSGAVTKFSETQTATETVDGSDWYISSLIFENLPIDTGNTVEITVADISGVGNYAQVGQIVLGNTHTLGTIVDGTRIGFDDFSLKTQDAFGNFTIVERGTADTADVEFKHATELTWWVKGILVSSRSTPALFWATKAMIDEGVFVFGYTEEPVTTTEVAKSVTSLSITGISYAIAGVI